MFDPWNPRSTYSLFPLENLLYCEDCGQVRCPRCVIEEIVCYFCPNCLFEVPSATVKAEGNRYAIPRPRERYELTEPRCNRNCFQCPLCFASLSVVASDPFPPTDSATGLPQGPFLLLCNFCHWFSAKVGIEFQKPTSITTQLSKMQTAAASSIEEFDKLKLHYSQKGKAAQEEYAGSGALNRLIGMYSGITGKRGLVGKSKKVEVGEAPEVQEIENEDEIIEQMRRCGFGDCNYSLLLAGRYMLTPAARHIGGATLRASSRTPLHLGYSSPGSPPPNETLKTLPRLSSHSRQAGS